MQNITQGFHLSPQQARLWSLQEKNAAYRAFCSILIEGNLAINSLERAVKRAMSRNGAYRTYFQRSVGLTFPLQVVHAEPFYTWQHIDLSMCSREEQESKIEELLWEKKCIDLEQGPLEFFLLITLAPEKYTLLVHLHALSADKRTLHNLVNELASLYDQELIASDLSDEKEQYLQFSEWQNTLLEEEEGRRVREYWHKQDITTLSSLSLPLEKKAEEQERFTPALLSLSLHPTIQARLEELCTQEAISLEIFLLTCWVILLARLTGQSKILVGLGIDNRVYEELAEIAGPCAKYIPVIGLLAGDHSFREMLLTIAHSVADALQWQDYFTLGAVDSETQPFPFGFDFSRQTIHYHIKEATFSLSRCYVCSEPFKIKISVVQTSAALLTEFHFDSSIFCESEVRQLAGYFHTLVQSAVSQPQTQIDHLGLLNEAEQKRILLTFNATDTRYPANLCFHQLFEEQVKHTPEGIALLLANDEELTYRELNHRANQVAHYLQRQGIGPESLVGICMERSPDMIIGILAVLKTGGAFVSLDTAYPQDRLAFMLDNARITTVLTHHYLPDFLATYPSTVVYLDKDWPIIAQERKENLAVTIRTDNLAYLIYTSGSTGKPKGVMITHQGVGNLSRSQVQAFRVQPGSRVLQFASLNFDASISELAMTLLAGATLCLFPPSSLFPGPDLLNVLRQYQITHVTLPPSALGVLPIEQLPSLQSLIVAGEACPIDVLIPWMGQHAIFNAYGPTETTVCATLARVEELPPPNIGRPISNTRIYVLDQHLQPVPIGVAGEIYIAGVGLARGYLRQPEWTAEHFVPDPFGPQSGQRLYKTGDRGRYQPDSSLIFLGRSDTQVKLRAFRIELGEIEATLQQCPGVQYCAVIVREDQPGEKRLAAYVVEERWPNLSIQDLRDFLHKTLPEYMIPAYFVLMDNLPLMPNGKVDRSALPEPSTVEIERLENFIAPRGPIEQILADIWRDILGLAHISINDNFFEAGGHSLLATQALLRAGNALQVDVPLEAIFETPTIAGLAQYIEHHLRRDEPGAEVPALLPASRHGPLPLSFAQQRLWFLDQLEPGSTIYNIPTAVRFRGPLQIAILQQSLNRLQQRHESLRTTFQTSQGQPTQVISPPAGLPLLHIDLTPLSSPEREQAVQHALETEATQPFALSQGPLIRLRLLRLAPQESVLLLTLHHIISDGWSMDILIRELSLFYTAAVARQVLELPALPIHYADYALWQRQWLQGAVLEAHLQYWRQQLADLVPLHLQTDHGRPAVQSYHGASVSGWLSAQLSQQLKELSQRQGTTLFMTLLATFQVLLARYSGKSVIAVGTPTANRTRQEIEGLIGFFVNTLVLCTDLSGDPTFEQVLGRVREVALGAYMHQEVPFEKLVEVLQPQRDMSRSPLFQVLFTLQQRQEAPADVAGVQVSQVRGQDQVAKFELSLTLTETRDGLYCSLEYNSDLFEEETMQRWLGHWQRLTEQLCTTPEQPISRVTFLDAQERQQLLAWQVHETYEGEEGLHQLFETQAQRVPEAIALQDEQQSLTYATVNRRANQLARSLRTSGVGPEVLVGICLHRSVELVIAILAVLKAGAAYVPLDPDYPTQRLEFMVRDTQVPVILTQKHQLLSLPPCEARIVCLDTITQVEDEKQDNLDSEEFCADTLAYVIYTSGSTGWPKGTMNTHRGMCNRLRWGQQRYPLTTADRFLHEASFSFDGSVWELLWPLMAGARVIISKPGGQRDSHYLVKLMANQQVTAARLGSSLLNVLLEEPEFEECNHLRHVFCGGEVLPVELQTRFLSHMNACSLHNVYGPTEAAANVMAWDCQKEWIGQTVPLGRPIPNVQIYLLDAALQLAPMGLVGEIYIGGRNVGRGYLNHPDLTAEKFIPDPFSGESGARLYKTGDLARYNALIQAIEFVGRSDHQVKLRGFRIELGEIEKVLLKHTQVRAAVVLAYEGQQSNKRLAAYVIPKEDVPLSPDDLRSYCQLLLPEYMVPSTFVPMERFPLTAHSKIDREALLAVEEIPTVTGGMLTEPHNPIEEVLSNIWRELLGRERISVHENFFEAGGHSLLATQAISRVRTTFKIELPLRSLFEAPTIEGLAQSIEHHLRRDEPGAEVPALLPTSHHGPLPLSFAQQRLWFLDQLEPGSTIYNIPTAVRFRGPLQIAILQQSLNRLQQRHESLRTTFQTNQGQPTQVVSPPAGLPLLHIDLTPLSSPEREQAVQYALETEATQPFALSQGPLIRLRLLRLAPQESVLLLTLHHIISDGWSMDILIRELSLFYTAAVARQVLELPALPIHYADYALWQRQWLQGAVLEAHLQYWRQQLADLVPLHLQTDHGRPAVQSYHGASVSGWLSAQLSQQLKELSQRQGTTLFMTLLATFQVLLARYSGKSVIAVGTPTANRTRQEIEGLIGFFVNTLVLCTDLSGDPTFEQVLGRVREVALGAYMHQEVPFEKLVEVLQPQRDMSRSPLFQVLFTLQQGQEAPADVAGVQVSQVRGQDQVAKFELSLTLTETREGLYCSLEYNSDLFEAETIQRWLGHWQRLTERLCTTPEQPISRVTFLDAQELQQFLAWQVHETYEGEEGLHQLFETQAQRVPEAIALQDEQQSLTYATVNRRANQLARSLRTSGVGPEVLVGICLQRSVELVIAILAVLKAGAAYVPLDPDYPTQRLEFILADAQIPVVLTQQSLVDRLPATNRRMLCMDSDWPVIAQESNRPLTDLASSEHTAYVIYTSGSTGTPKGVAVSHSNVTRLFTATQSQFSFNEHDIWTFFHSYAFDFSVWELWGALLYGGRLILVPYEISHSFEDFYLLLRTHNVTVLNQTPSAFYQLMFIEEDSRRQEELALRLIIFGGEALNLQRLQPWFDRHGDQVPQLINMYGITETTVHVTYRPLKAADARMYVGSVIGTPISDLDVYVLDQHLQPVPIGIPGQMYVGGAGLSRGYLRRPELTAERFIPHPFSSTRGARLYKTGDLARILPQGELEYLGRADHQVKVRGFRIEPGEIEAVLSQHPAVKECTVVLREDAPGDKRLVVYVVTDEETASGELRTYLQGKLPDYMLPAHYIRLTALPLTANGKLDLLALPALHSIESDNASIVAPRNAIEEALVDIWSEILDQKHISIQANFFEIGGHSLLATQLISHVRAVLQVEVPLRCIFDAPTIAEFAAIVSAYSEEVNDENASQLLAELEQLSQEEVRLLLNAERD